MKFYFQPVDINNYPDMENFEVYADFNTACKAHPSVKKWATVTEGDIEGMFVLDNNMDNGRGAINKVGEDELMEQVTIALEDMGKDDFVETVNYLLGTNYEYDDILWANS